MAILVRELEVAPDRRAMAQIYEGSEEICEAFEAEFQILHLIQGKGQIPQLLKENYLMKNQLLAFCELF